MPFDGLRVLSLESRRAKEMDALIRRHGGEPFVAPSLKEQATDDSSVAVRFVEQLEAGEFDMVICMTGVGMAFLRDAATERMPVERLAAALRKATVVARGPKPVPVLRGMGVAVDIAIPEPNTWKQIVEAVALRPERRIAVQEYGRPNMEMYAALQQMGARVTPFAVYRWELPDDLTPLREAVRCIVNAECDVILLTSSIQVDHLFEIAAQEGLEHQVRQALIDHVVVASVGPMVTSAIETRGIAPDIVPDHPKMAPLLIAAAEGAHRVLSTKRAARTAG